jgi:hypothetical protein
LFAACPRVDCKSASALALSQVYLHLPDTCNEQLNHETVNLHRRDSSVAGIFAARKSSRISLGSGKWFFHVIVFRKQLALSMASWFRNNCFLQPLCLGLVLGQDFKSWDLGTSREPIPPQQRILQRNYKMRAFRQASQPASQPPSQPAPASSNTSLGFQSCPESSKGVMAQGQHV